MRQIVYFSTAAGRQDSQVIAAIVALSRGSNARENISGLLVAGGNRYLQVLEGPSVAVTELMKRIRGDQRHVGVTLLVSRKIAARSFAAWSMAYFDEPGAGDYHTLTQLIDRMRAHVPEHALRDQIDCLERRFAIAALAPPKPIASPWTLASRYVRA
jgi:hypothetical protein